MLFLYRYINSKGKKKSGMIDAEGILEAKETLRSQNILVTSLEQAVAKKRRLFQKKEQLCNDHLITFTTQLSQLLTAGMPLYESLLSLEEQYRTETFHPIILSLSSHIKKGTSLSEAMTHFPTSFSPLYCSMIAAGESVGALDTSLEKLALLLGKQRKLKKQLITALLYPCVLFCFSLIVCILLMTFVIPSLQTLFEDHTVNRFTRFVMQMSDFLIHGQLIYLPIIGAFTTGCIYFVTSKKGKRKLQSSLFYLPVIKTLVVQTALARFCRTMGTMLQGGVAIISALQISRKVMRNPILEEIIEAAESKIVEGSMLSQELKQSPLIPALVPRLLAIGEEGGNGAAMFHKIADLYEEELEKTLNRITALAQPVILVAMGGIVGLIMLAVLLPLTDVNAFL